MEPEPSPETLRRVDPQWWRNVDWDAPESDRPLLVVDDVVDAAIECFLALLTLDKLVRSASGYDRINQGELDDLSTAVDELLFAALRAHQAMRPHLCALGRAWEGLDHEYGGVRATSPMVAVYYAALAIQSQARLALLGWQPGPEHNRALWQKVLIAVAPLPHSASEIAIHEKALDRHRVQIIQYVGIHGGVAPGHDRARALWLAPECTEKHQAFWDAAKLLSDRYKNDPVFTSEELIRHARSPRNPDDPDAEVSPSSHDKGTREDLESWGVLGYLDERHRYELRLDPPDRQWRKEIIAAGSPQTRNP